MTYTIDRAAIEAAVRELTIAQEGGLIIEAADEAKPPDA